MVLNIIYDNRVVDRLPLLLEDCNNCKIEYRIWEACIDKKTVTESITESFRRIIQWAKDNKMKEVFIAEDDLSIVSLSAWEYFLKNKPKDFDVYIGGSYLRDNKWVYEAPLVKVDIWVGNHLIVVNEKYYDRWLESKPDGHIDTEQNGKGDFYVCYPYIALQRPSFSANTKTMVNYNSLLKDEDIYKG